MHDHIITKLHLRIVTLDESVHVCVGVVSFFFVPCGHQTRLSLVIRTPVHKKP